MERVLSRASLPGLALLALGAWWILGAQGLCRVVFGEKGQRFVMPLKGLGMILAIVGALIVLDFIPGL